MNEFKWYDVNVFGMPNSMHDMDCLIVIDANGIGIPEGIYPAVWDHKDQRFKAFDSYVLTYCRRFPLSDIIDDKHNVIAWALLPSYSRDESGRPYNMIGAPGGKLKE